MSCSGLFLLHRCTLPALYCTYLSSPGQKVLVLLEDFVFLVEETLQVADGLVSELQGVLAARVVLFAQVGEKLFPVGGGGETEAELVDDSIPRQDVLLGLPQRRLLLLQLLLKRDTTCLPLLSLPIFPFGQQFPTISTMLLFYLLIARR